MNLESDQSNTLQDKSSYHYLHQLQSMMDLYVKESVDPANLAFMTGFFKSLLSVTSTIISSSQANKRPVEVRRTDIAGIIAQHLSRDWPGDPNSGMACITAALKHLTDTSGIPFQQIDATKIIFKQKRDQAVALDQQRWTSYLKVANLYEYFLYHFDIGSDISALSFASMFTMIVNGCHFHRSYFSIVAAVRADFNADHSFILLQKQFQSKRSQNQPKVRFFLSDISVFFLLRLGLAQKKADTKSDTMLFSSSIYSNDNTAKELGKDFRRWLNKLVASYNAHINVKRGKEQYGSVIESLSIPELYHGAQIWTAMRAPFFQTSYLNQRIVPGQLTQANFKALFSDETPLCASDSFDTHTQRSWVNMRDATSDQELTEYDYSMLMNLHSCAGRIIHEAPNKITKTEKVRLISEIQSLVESLPRPYSQMDQIENGYLSNYRLLLEWLAEMLQTKKPETAFEYFSALANAIFFELGNNCIVSFDVYELGDIVFEILHSSQSPRTQRNLKSKLKQFLSFLCAHYALPALNWKSPDFWIIDEPLERQIMSFSEFDRVCDKMDSLPDVERGKTLKAVIILLFYAGLRIHEAALLSHEAIYIDSELNIFIKKSKTRAGRRSLPLHLLLPHKELQFFRDLVIARRPLETKKGMPLFSLDGKLFPHPEVLARMITGVIFSAIEKRFTCHQLRHSFASWLLIRWYVRFFGLTTIKKHFVDYQHPVFADDELQKIRILFLGHGARRIGDEYFAHAIFAISKLMGHASPETTVNVYVHTIDILYRFFVIERDEKVFFSIARAAKLLNVSKPKATDVADAGNMLSATKMMEHCLQEYRDIIYSGSKPIDVPFDPFLS